MLAKLRFRAAGGRIFTSFVMFAFLCTPTLHAQTVGPPPQIQPTVPIMPIESEPDSPYAGGDTQVYQEYGERMRSAQMVSPLSSDVFGENVNLFDGQTEFSNVDISVPGNSTLPVQLRRRLSVIRAPDLDATTYGGAGNWDLDVPYMSGVFLGGDNWGAIGSSTTYPRCSDVYYPSIPAPFSVRDVFTGTSVHLPGKGDSELFSLPGSGSAIYPSDGQPHVWTTRNFDAFTCTTALANSSSTVRGQGFVMKTPEGLTYTFDWMTTRGLGMLGSGDALPHRSRVRVYLLATRIEDRYGNRVDYSYNGLGHPTSIRGYVAGQYTTPEREITLAYTGSGSASRLLSATAHGRTWDYGYLASGRFQRLKTVSQPTSSDILAAQRPRWSYAYSNDRVIVPQVWDGNGCDEVPTDYALFTLEVTHPAGAKGTFEFVNSRTYRSGIPSIAGCPSPTAPDQRIEVPNYADGFALVRKVVDGVGVSPLEWLYDSGGSYEGYCDGLTPTTGNCAAATLERTVTVTEPDGSKKRHRFGIRFETNHGRLLGTETVSVAAASLSTTQNTYFETTPTTFPAIYGIQWGGDDTIAQRIRPVRIQSETRQGITFSRTTATSDYDGYARPLKVTRSSTLPTTNGPNSRTETTVYQDNTVKWLLGQVASVTELGGAVMQANTYDAMTLDRLTESRFGKLQRTMTYNSDGTLNTVKDGLNQTTTLSNYYRGIPQRIDYADGRSQTASINLHGQITGVTNEEGFTTGYQYREDGRIKQIDYPSSDTVAWNATTLSFVPVSSAEYGIPGSHWRQTISTGNARTITYFDGLWRPVAKRTYDTANVSGTERMVLSRFDHTGKATFAAYPRRTLCTAATTISNCVIDLAVVGVASTYDALGRLTQSSAASELGALNTVILYQPGFKKQVTNPRGFVTTTSYQAFDEPSEDSPSSIVEPGTLAANTVTTTITRDVFGMPSAMKREGSELVGSPAATVNATRRYVYDSYKRVCKTIEPESGATVVDYDAAGNVAWRAAGQALTSTTDCQRANLDALPNQKTTYVYDSRNRLTDTTYGDASPSINTTYTADGLPLTVSSDGIVWTYNYNKRRLLESEALVLSAGNYNIGHAYTANGHEATLTYPDGISVGYAPNALGEQTQAGIYATNVTRHPNGAIATFSYGNGIVHTGNQTDRGLPDLSSDASTSLNVLDDDYDWDENGNVTAIVSGIGAGATRHMQYDARDRLTQTTYNKLGPALVTFTYDPLDNLRSYSTGTGGRNYVHDYSATTNRLTRIYEQVGSTQTNKYEYGYTGEAGNRGNVTSRAKVDDGTSQIFAFDQGNRMRTLSGTASETYGYDGMGRRARIIVAGGISRGQIYSQAGNFLETVSCLPTSRSCDARGSYNATTDYIYLDRHLVASIRVDAPALPKVTYQHTDGLGSPVAETDATGALIASTRTLHEPYGLLVSTALTPSPLRQGPGYTGHVVDAATGLSYMQQRYYDPIAGRFLSVDPVAASAGSFNRYWYANNNPYRYIDPDGRYVCDGSKSACAQLSKAVDTLNKAIENLPKGSQARDSLSEVSAFIGKEGQSNGVTIAASAKAGVAGTGRDNGGTRISINIETEKRIATNFNVPLLNEMAATLAHEGRHGIDDAQGNSNSRNQLFKYEKRAARTESHVWRGLSTDSPWQTWTQKSGYSESAINNEAEASAKIWCMGNDLCK